MELNVSENEIKNKEREHKVWVFAIGLISALGTLVKSNIGEVLSDRVYNHCIKVVEDKFSPVEFKKANRVSEKVLELFDLFERGEL